MHRLSSSMQLWFVVHKHHKWSFTSCLNTINELHHICNSCSILVSFAIPSNLNSRQQKNLTAWQGIGQDTFCFKYWVGNWSSETIPRQLHIGELDPATKLLTFPVGSITYTECWRKCIVELHVRKQIGRMTQPSRVNSGEHTTVYLWVLNPQVLNCFLSTY